MIPIFFDVIKQKNVNKYISKKSVRFQHFCLKMWALEKWCVTKVAHCIICQLNKMINNLSYHYLQEMIPQRVQKQIRYSLRNQSERCILSSAIRQWNLLDQDVRESSSLQTFKYKLTSQHRTPPIYFDTIQTPYRTNTKHPFEA